MSQGVERGGEAQFDRGAETQRRPEEIVTAALYLASSKSSFTPARWCGSMENC